MDSKQRDHCGTKLSLMEPFIVVRPMSKLQGGAVDYHVKFAVLLANTRTTLRGSQASRYYGLTPPTLESYFQ